jgi:hypothetical protein
MGWHHSSIILASFHFILDMVPFIYICFFSKKYDIYIVIVVFLQCFHWLLLKNECSLSYLEKKILNNNYKLGDEITFIPHEDIYYLNKQTVIFMHLLQICVFIYILYRNINNLLIVLLSFINISIMIYIFKIRYFV